MCWTGGIGHRVQPQLRQRRGQNPRATSSAQGQSPSLTLPTIFSAWHYVPKRQWTTRSGHRLGSSKLRRGLKAEGTNSRSWRTTGVPTQESSSGHPVHELILAPPPPRPQISHSILTQAEGCAIHAVARCELGLLALGARVYWQ